MAAPNKCPRSAANQGQKEKLTQNKTTNPLGFTASSAPSNLPDGCILNHLVILKVPHPLRPVFGPDAAGPVPVAVRTEEGAPLVRP